MQRALPYLLIAYMLFVLLSHLDDHQLEYYDEARRAVSSIEMAKGDSHWLVPTYAGESDHFEVKPPLLIWIQSLFLRVLGFGLLAVRLPSTLATLLMTGLLVYWGRKEWGSRIVGLLAVFILLTSVEYMRNHGARTADYEAFLLLFLMGQLTCAHRWVTTGKDRFVWGLGLFVFLAAFTKGIAGCLILPGIGLWLLSTRQGRRQLLRPWIYLSVGLALALVVGYYFIRDGYDPGYFAMVRYQEWGGRFSGLEGEHRQPFYFYVHRMLSDAGFSVFFALFPAAVVAAIRWGNHLHPARLCAISTVFFLLVISAAQTKLYWYKAPAQIMVAMTTAYLLVEIYRRLRKVEAGSPVVALALLVGICFYPALNMVTRVTSPRRYQETPYHKFPFRAFMRDPRSVPPYTLLARGYNPVARFDMEVARSKGLDVELKYSRTSVLPSARTTGAQQAEFTPGERVVICHQKTWEYVFNNYHTSDEFSVPPCKMTRIGKPRSEPISVE